MNRREFIESAAVAAGLTIVSIPIVTEVAQAKEFYVADWMESSTPPDRDHVILAFERAMKKHEFTRIYDLQYRVEYSTERVAYFHIFSAKLI